MHIQKTDTAVVFDDVRRWRVMIIRYAGAIRAQWISFFVITALSGIAAVLLLLWALNGFQGLGLDTAGTIALVLGIVFTSALGVALMALMFYSDRSNLDADAHHTAIDADDREKEGAGASLGKTPPE